MNINDLKHYSFSELNRSVEEAKELCHLRQKDAITIFNKHSHHFIPRNCPICNGEEHKEEVPFLSLYSISHCEHCNSNYVNPAPNIEAIEDYYLNGECNKMMQSIYKKRAQNSQSKILDDRVREIVNLYNTEKTTKDTFSILEIGCGTGVFLKKLKDHFFNLGMLDHVSLHGIDIDANAIELNEDLELNLEAVPIEKFNKTGRQYDLIIHFELIEHLADPREFMRICSSLLKKKGKMLFTTPNASGIEMTAMPYNGFRPTAHAIYPPMHLNAFSTENISLFLYQMAYKLKKISTPGKLDMDMIAIGADTIQDSFYRSFDQLSEREMAISQELLKRSNSSSHMLVVAEKSN